MTDTVTPPPPVEPTVLKPVDESALAALFTSARTASSFADTPVSDEELTAIWELARWAPTGGNTQPLRVLFVRTEEGRDRLLPLLAEGNRPKAAGAPVTAVLAVDTEFHEHIPTVFPIRPEMKDYFAADDALRISSAEFNGAIQAGYFILAVRALGLAAGPMGGFDKAAVDAEFFPGGRYRSTLVVNIGHPGERPWFGRLPRLDHDTAVTWA